MPILLNTNLTKDSRNPYITGNHEYLGNRETGTVQRKLRSPGIGEGMFRIEEGFPLEYKFSLGSCSRDAVGMNGAPYSNFRLNVTGNTLEATAVKNRKSTSESASGRTSVTGCIPRRLLEIRHLAWRRNKKLLYH